MHFSFILEQVVLFNKYTVIHGFRLCVVNSKSASDAPEYTLYSQKVNCFEDGLSSSSFALLAVLSKVDDFATFKKVEVHAENSTFYKVEVV